MVLMIAKATRKLGYVLLDANVIIEAYALGVWNKLLDRTKTVIPSTVVQDEAFYFDKKKSGKRLAIDLNEFIDSGRILEVGATATELQNLRNIFDDLTLEGLDPGELEALALLHTSELKGAVFCTADKAAIRALALMGCCESGISMEELLQICGLQKPLELQYKRKFFEEQLAIGKQNRIAGFGLRK